MINIEYQKIERSASEFPALLVVLCFSLMSSTDMQYAHIVPSQGSIGYPGLIFMDRIIS